MTTSKQALKQAISLAKSGKGLQDALRCGLDGCPVGGWAETAQAMRRIRDELPTDRAYTVDQFVAALYAVDHADRYRYRA